MSEENTVPPISIHTEISPEVTPTPTVPVEATPVPPVVETPPAPATPVVSAIVERLASEAKEVTAEESSKPQANTPMMFDMSNLTPEQLSVLKSMLGVTPERVQQKRGNIRIEIRKVSIEDVDRYIVDFKRTRMTLGYHAETGKEAETPVIPVLLNGATEYIDMDYTEFMQSDRVGVEVLSQRSEEHIIEEGQVKQRETGKIVMKELKTIDYFYTVKLPNGETVELQGKIANA